MTQNDTHCPIITEGITQKDACHCDDNNPFYIFLAFVFMYLTLVKRIFFEADFKRE